MEGGEAVLLAEVVELDVVACGLLELLLFVEVEYGLVPRQDFLFHNPLILLIKMNTTIVFLAVYAALEAVVVRHLTRLLIVLYNDYTVIPHLKRRALHYEFGAIMLFKQLALLLGLGLELGTHIIVLIKIIVH